MPRKQMKSQMKLLQKILAVILSMALVLVAFPFAVFADKPDPKQVETPRYTSDIGVGASGSVTITLSLSTISELLGALGDRDELKAKLEAMMVKEGDLITIGDIMEIVPFEAVLEIILGESGTGLGTLVERLGGAHAVLDMVDVDQIILSATRETDAVDPSVHPLENVINIITALEGFEATVNTGAVLALDLPISFVELYNYVDLDKLRDKFASLSYSDKLAIFSDFDGFVEALVAGLKAGTLEDGNGDPLTFGQMLDPTRADPDNVNAVVNDLIALDSDLLAIVVSDVLNAGLNVPAGAYTVDLDMVKSVLNENAGFKTALIADILNPANDVLTTDGMEALMDLVDTTVIAAAAVSLFGAHDDYYVLDDVIASFTPAGQTRLYQLGGATPSKEDALQVLTEDIDADYTLQYFDVAALQSAITDAGRAATAEKLLNDGLLNIAPADLNAFISNGSYYNFANFASRVVARIDANGVALDSVATFTAAELIADPDILDFLCGKLGDYFERFTVSQILGVADAHGGMEQFLSTGIYTNESLIDLALTYENDAYLYISVSDMVEALLDGSLSNLPSVLKDGESFATILQDGTVITVDEVMTCIRASGNPLQTFVDFDAIFTILEAHPDKMGNLLKQVETDVLAEQFSDNMKEIFEALTKAQYSDLINLVLASGEVCITRVLLAGYEVAKRNDISGLLEFNFDAIVAALWEIVPKFEEIGDDGFNGVLTAFNFRMFYETVSGVDKEKDINVTIKMAGDLENVRRVAKVLDRYIKLEKTNNYFQLTINVPSYVTDLYRYVLEEGDSEAVVSLRQKLLAMECLTGAEIAEALSELPFSEVVAGLRDIDVNHLYERIVATGMVEKLLQKMDQYFGLHVSMESMETLDTVLEHFRSDNLSTIADLIHHVTVRTGDDLMAALEKVAKVADENEYAQRLINRAASIPVFGKFFENFDAEDLLAEYKDMDPVEAIVRYATEKLEYDFLSEFYSDQTAAELYQSGLDYAEAHLGEAYEDLCLLISHLMDPGYVPQTEREERIWSLIPQIVLDRASDHSLLSCYRGNGTFSATRDCADLSVTNLSERFVNLAARFVSMSDDLKAYALTLLPAGTFYYAANLTVNFSGLYQVDYYKKDGTLWFSTFLPEEIDPKVVPLPVEEKFQANDWTDAPDGTGEVVEKITGDQALYPSYTELFTVNYEYDNAVIGSEQVLDGELLANLPADPDLPDNDHNWALGYFVNDVEIDPATYPVTEDITVTLKYIQLTDTVTWKNGDEVIYEEEVAFGETPVYDEATYGTPEKAATAQFTYAFIGWSPDIDPLTGAVVYTAQFSETTNKYTVTWKNGETVIYSEEVEFGETPVYNGATPAGYADKYYTYTFSGWTPDVVAVTEAATYSAKFDATAKTFTIFVKIMPTNSTISIQDVTGETTIAELKAILATETGYPVAQQKLVYGGTLLDDDKTLAEYNIEKEFILRLFLQTYTVTWKNGDEIIYAEEVEYGVVPEYDTATYGTPAKAGTAQVSYTFTGWGEIAAVTGEAVYSAQFSETTNKYTVTWKNGDEIIYSEEVEYGVVPEYDEATYGTPEKAATAQFT